MTSPSLPGNPNAELKARYESVVLSGNRFVLSSLVILFLLSVIVIQEIREQERRVALLTYQITAAVTRGQKLRRRLGILFDRALSSAQDMRGWDSIFVSRSPPDSVVPYRAAILRDSVMVAELQDLDPRALSRRSQADWNAGLSSLQGLVVQLGVSDNEDLSPTFPNLDEARVRRTRPWVEDNDHSAFGLARSMRLHSFVPSLLEYHQDYRKYVKAQASIELTVKSVRETLARRSKSLPTPFGSFDINPKLALWGLVAAALLTYLALLQRVAETQGLARRYWSAVHQPVGTTPGPFWAYGANSDVPEVLGWTPLYAGRMRLFAFMTHLGWLALPAVLVAEGFRWRAEKAVLVPPGRYVGFVAVMCIILAIAASSRQLLRPSPQASGTLDGGGSQSEPTETIASRRWFLYSLGVLLLALIAVTIRRGRVGSARFVRRLVPRGQLLLPESWVANRRNGIAHYEPLCNDHLPKRRVGLGHDVKPDMITPHPGKEALFYELMALREVLRADFAHGEVRTYDIRPERANAMDYLNRAIGYSPLSLRLYDKLVRLFGEAKQYDKISLLLQGGLAKAKALGSAEGGRAAAAFEMRLNLVARKANKRKAGVPVR